MFGKMNVCEFQSIIRVVFHDRRLQYTEHQQLEGWRWNRPGDRILDLGEHRTKTSGLLWLLWNVEILVYWIGLCVERMFVFTLVCMYINFPVGFG